MKYFYTSPFAAGWMAAEHNMQFKSYYFIGTESHVIKEGVYDKVVVGWMRGEGPRRFYIHPDSVHLLEPRVGDLVQCRWGTERMVKFRTAQGEKVAAIDWGEDGLRADGKIIQRDGKPFFWPESEEA
jgi:hypothetical protein